MPALVLSVPSMTRVARERDKARALDALREMKAQDKISHRAANMLIERAVRESYGRTPLVTGWCGKVGTP